LAEAAEAAVVVVRTPHRLVETLAEFKEVLVQIKVEVAAAVALVEHSLMGLAHLHPTVAQELLEAYLAEAAEAEAVVVL
jgi:16S rRNA C1402 (ribose-2'-O) methylase RsmI